eukprot:TRINITY_DN11591_c0_g6_i3.p1 TRINITY_DN11591_c0_g6~~TRINITY_DN11591_c0_g6_i3.p1  ORF type:complete len:271 (+),score=34.02 TRINITY_DN11591_c0_g6_i3:70-882(+)
MDDFISTSLACIAANLVTHPLEMVKVRQQISVLPTQTFPALLYHIVQTEGIKALYKGLGAGLLRGVISGGGRIAIYNQLKLAYPQYGSSAHRVLMGMGAGLIAAWLANPFDYIRTVQQAQKGKTTSMMTLTRETVQKHGFTSLWTGTSAILLRAAFLNASQLVSYDKAKVWCSTKFGLGLDDIPTHIFASLVAGFVATVTTAPLEMIKTYMQTHNEKMLASFWMILKNQGILAMWRGFSPLYVKIAPHTLIVLVLTDQFRQFFGVEQVVT